MTFGSLLGVYNLGQDRGQDRVRPERMKDAETEVQASILLFFANHNRGVLLIPHVVHLRIESYP